MAPKLFAAAGPVSVGLGGGGGGVVSGPVLTPLLAATTTVTGTTTMMAAATSATAQQMATLNYGPQTGIWLTSATGATAAAPFGFATAAVTVAPPHPSMVPN
jgi:hypothetical protein